MANNKLSEKYKLLKKYYDEGWSSESIAVELKTDAQHH